MAVTKVEAGCHQAPSGVAKAIPTPQRPSELSKLSGHGNIRDSLKSLLLSHSETRLGRNFDHIEELAHTRGHLNAMPLIACGPRPQARAGGPHRAHDRRLDQ